MKNWYKIAQSWTEEDDAASRYYEIEGEERRRVLNEFARAKKTRKAKPNTQPWPVIPAARLIKIWNDYATMGVVRDEQGMNEIADRVIRNVARLAVNTEIVGHTEIDASEVYAEDYEDYGIKSEKDKEKLILYPQHDKYSDYALKPLQTIVSKLLQAKTAEEKLLLVDQALNVIHQRGDIAAIFVEGGSKTLNQLFERGTRVAFNLYNMRMKKKASKTESLRKNWNVKLIGKNRGGRPLFQLRYDDMPISNFIITENYDIKDKVNVLNFYKLLDMPDPPRSPIIMEMFTLAEEASGKTLKELAKEKREEINNKEY